MISDIATGEIKSKLSFLKKLDAIDDELQIIEFVEKVPNNEFSLIQELHQREPDNPLIQVAISTGYKLANFMLSDSDCPQNTIWVIRDLLGHECNRFFTLPLNQSKIGLIDKKIKSLGYDNFPFVILARYVPAKFREQLVDGVILYADQPDHDMSWASSAEACETLGFLNCLPKESIQCLGRNLIDLCDGSPLDNVLFVLPVFKKHMPLIVKPLQKFILEEFADSSIVVHQLSKSITDPHVAREILPMVKQYMVNNGVLDWIRDEVIFNHEFEDGKEILALYGQLNLLAGRG